MPNLTNLAANFLSATSKYAANDRDRVVNDGARGVPNPVQPLHCKGQYVAIQENQHQKVFRLISVMKIEEATKIAARLINNGDHEAFLTYGGTVPSGRAERWFTEKVRASKPEGVAEVELISPELAQILLVNNDGNRKVRARQLAKYMRDMIDGRWEINGETCKVSLEGKTNDCQHRAWAVVLSGCAIKSYIVFGLSRASMGTVDIGEKRTAADRAMLRGEPDGIVMCAIAALAFEMDYGYEGSADEADDYLLDHLEEIRRGRGAAFNSIKGLGPSTMATAAIHLMRIGATPDEIKRFYKIVDKNEGTAKGNAARTLHYQLFPKDPTKTPALKQKRGKWVSTICHHFIAWRNDYKTASVILDEPLPETL